MIRHSFAWARGNIIFLNAKTRQAPIHAGFTKLELGVRFIALKNAVGCVRGPRAEIASEKPGQQDNTTNREIPHCVEVF